MEYTKDEVKQKIIEILNDSPDKINPSVITQKLGWNKDLINEVCTLFNVKRFSEVLKEILDIEFEKNENRTTYIQLVQKDKLQISAESEEKMAENETKSQNLHDRIKDLRDAIGEGLYEKDEPVRLALLTAIAGESIFFLGAPGCAKSMIARRVVKAFKADGDKAVKYFETLLNQFTTPEEVFGNISLKALNGELEDENGDKKEEYRRLTENMLPEADIAFLDEIWKASPAILNTLLTIINERKFHNGGKVEDIPLKALFAASNELPQKNAGLEALYDRFVLRLCVDYIQNEDNFFEMISGSSSSDFELSEEVKNLQITNEDLTEWKKQIDEIEISDEAKAVISAIRKELVLRNNNMGDEDKKNGEMFEVGDRRWKKIAHILKASAFLNGRKSVDLMDCQLIEYCIWSTEKQQKLSREIVEKCIKENGVDCDSAIEDINEQIEEFKEAVNEQWFEEVKEPKMYDMKDGHRAYKIMNPAQIYSYQYITPAYLCKDYEHEGYDRKGAYYDNNRDFIGDYDYYFEDDTFRISEGTAEWTDGYRNQHHSFEIEMIGSNKPKKFSDIAHSTLQKNFNTEHYAPIVDAIQKQIDELKAQKAKDEIPFKANLFADQSYNTSITSKIDGAIRELQDANVALDKEKNRYHKSELVAKLAVGDVILKNGSIFTADEIGNLTAEQKANVIAVVAVAGEKIYAIGLEQYKIKWDDIAKTVSEYGTKNNLPNGYASNWAVPDKDLLNEIWENREAINKSLEALGEEPETLSEEEYWSLTENGDSAAFYQTFDENGEQDDTTKSHEYAVCVVREWSV